MNKKRQEVCLKRSFIRINTTTLADFSISIYLPFLPELDEYISGIISSSMKWLEEYDKSKGRGYKEIFPGKNGKSGTNGGVEALGGINLEVKDGEFIAIVGPSGCGKSTFLEITAGLIKPTSGSIYIDGKAINGPDHDRGIVFQGYALFPWRTVLGNIAYGLEEKGVPKKTRNEICRKYISLVGLTGFEDHYPYQLSGGMKQRVAIARALAYKCNYQGQGLRNTEPLLIL